MNSKKQISVIVPSFHSEALTKTCIRSFILFCPTDIQIQYIIVENSNDVSYKDDIVSMDENIKWINNETRLLGSEANAEAIEIGLIHADCEMVFMCHCDTCVTSEKFLRCLVSKCNDGFSVVGTRFSNSPIEINPLHISGLLADVNLSKMVKYAPRYKNGIQFLDVGDSLTQYCVQNKIKTYCFRNTYNSQDLIDVIEEKYRGFCVDRCIDDFGNVIFMHLGRGIPKTNGTYQKPNKVALNDWVEFCRKVK
jgi:hypothetical protein